LSAKDERKIMARASVYIVTGLVGIGACEAVHSAQYIIPQVRDVETRTGAPVLIGRFVDCRSHAPYEGTAFAQHGKVTMKRATVNNCGDPGYKGIDEANFSYVSGSALIVHITVR
jgi:hypothetical protein